MLAYQIKGDHSLPCDLTYCRPLDQFYTQMYRCTAGGNHISHVAAIENQDLRDQRVNCMSMIEMHDKSG